MSDPVPYTAVQTSGVSTVSSLGSNGTGGVAVLSTAQMLAIITAAIADAPETEPGASGVLWLNNGVLTLSEGIPPTFTLHPQSATVEPGETATLTWTATQADSFQVQRDTGSGWNNVSGATSSPYTTPVIELADTGVQYRVVATGPGGTTNSNTATLTIDLHASTTAYIARVESGGGTVTSDGIRLIDAIFEHADAETLTVLRGYLFGTSVNVDTSDTRTVLELTGDGEPLTADSVANDSTLYAGKGSVCLEGYTDREGYLQTTAESLVDNQDWTIFGYFQRPLIDTSLSGKTTFFMSQYNSFAVGRFWMEAGITGQFSFTPISQGAAVSIRSGSNYSGGAIIEPIPFFIRYNATTRVLTGYSPLSATQTGTTTLTTNWTALPTRFGSMQIASSAAASPQIMNLMGFLKYGQVLTDGQCDDVWDLWRTNHDRLIDRCWIVGNSVTSGADASEAGTNTGRNWPCLFTQEAAKNNMIVVRPLSMGGKTIYYFRPSDYTVPGASALVSGFAAYSSADSVDTWIAWKPNIWVIDENQNTAANESVRVEYEVDFGGCVDAIAADLIAVAPDLKIVCGTQLAVGPAGKSYATIISEETSVPSEWRKNLRDWSTLIRTDDRFDAVAEIYSVFNLGWDRGDDGNAATPATDYPNGNPSYFYDDHQHPNAAGHALMATAFFNAVQSVRA